MNICIGGCWHGSKLLVDQKTNYFLAKDRATSKPTRYRRFEVIWMNNPQVFWVADNLSHVEINQKIEVYLAGLKNSTNI
ncbi:MULTISPECIES: hypothetical protein [Acinetobacter]|uniref:hypothetical protein n=1 Tax=Acinetobacter TaxID=469 RepID=UPI002577315C|nr:MULTISPECIES: hypothetical protein [Acinetobacter]MDM1765741.1 hypothetical protein [Acinetobacter sp. 226-1]MDM1769481.1 hypothetical protein [Acinetobacter sp. 226-4]MDQ9022847.1 hypothetical protein [Acinetobacter sichuanensis]